MKQMEPFLSPCTHISGGGAVSHQGGGSSRGFSPPQVHNCPDMASCCNVKSAPGSPAMQEVTGGRGWVRLPGFLPAPGPPACPCRESKPPPPGDAEAPLRLSPLCFAKSAPGGGGWMDGLGAGRPPRPILPRPSAKACGPEAQSGGGGTAGEASSQEGKQGGSVLESLSLGLEGLIKRKRIVVHKESSKDLSRFQLDLFLKKIPKRSAFPAKRTSSVKQVIKAAV